MLDCQNKIALVTGATRGIGKAIALQLAKQGAQVIGTATRQAGADGITKYLHEAGAKGYGAVLDVADVDNIESVLNSIQQDSSTPTILVNNAGITQDNLLIRMQEKEWQTVMDTNLTAIFRMSKACLRGMTKAKWGRIINVSSVVGSMGNAGQSNYAATKAGLEGFSRSLAQEVASRNITVNCIAPGFIMTDMTSGLGDEQKELLMQRIPLKRLGKAEDIAAMVGFLAGDGAAYITGETIHVNGGMYMS